MSLATSTRTADMGPIEGTHWGMHLDSRARRRGNSPKTKERNDDNEQARIGHVPFLCVPQA